MTLLVLALVMQIGGGGYPPGQYPPGQYPPGQYPPGQYPQQGPSIPFPRKSKKKTDPTQSEMLQVIRGWVRSVDAKSIRIYSSDSRTVEVQFVEKTKKPEQPLKPGDYVEIEAAQDDKSQYLAATVKKLDPPKGEKAPRAELDQSPAEDPTPADVKKDEKRTKPPEPPERPEPPATIEKPQAKVSEAEAPPKLKRGIPAAKKRPLASDDDDSPVAPAAAAAAPLEVREVEPTGEVRRVSSTPADSRMELLEKAKGEAENFLGGLPNYMCKQFTTRYTGEGKPINWHPIDVVQAGLVYEDGRERYQNPQINGKAVKGKVEDTGTWSTGEFGTVLRDIFAPSTAAIFHYAGSMTVQRRQAVQYDFTVDREGSHWHIGVPGQYIEPEYRGSVWVDKESARVLRIEMQARKIPKDFPKDTTEMAIDYDFVTLGGTQKYLLPVKSEILSCTRGSSECEKNTIEFRNYRKFGAESEIIFKQ